jgi:pseudaminic acid cytidylyltransferase
MKSKILAIIPARGGSKRIPRKNIKIFLGKPIIAYSIEAALKSELFDEVMVSTDDKKIAQAAEKYGAKVPFMRSKRNSGDYAGTSDVIGEVLEEYLKRGLNFNIFCCIYPTAPLITVKTIKKGLNLLRNKKFDSVFPIVKFSYPIQRALKINNSKVEMFWSENKEKRSQDLEKAYHDAGQFYWMWTKKFIEQKRIFAKNSGAIILKESEVQDIDGLEDWKMAEMKYKLNNN